MAPEAAARTDAHARAHRADLGPETGNRPDFEPKTAGTPVTRDARVIQMRPKTRQGDQPEEIKPYEPPPGARPGGEFEAARALVSEAAEASDWSREPMTPVDAAKQITPAKGEAGNWIVWSGMTIAGLARLVLVTAGWSIARGGETRIRAGVALTVFLIALGLAYVAGHSA